MKKLFMILAVVFGVNAKAQVCFTSTNYTVGNTNEAIASADFNNDGKLDLAVSSYFGPPIYILFGNGLGGFGPSNIAYDSVGTRSMVSADFNNDGNADLATIQYGGTGWVKILFGNGTGTFPARDSFMVGPYPFSICSADFNGDGKPDLATANGGGGVGNASVLLNNGSGSFSPHADFLAGDGPVAIASGDFNGDGKLDLAVANDGNGGGTDSVAVLLGNGAGSFGIAAKYLTGSGPYSVCSKDFNADGYADIAVANQNSYNVSVLLSRGTSGAFFPATNYATGGDPWSIVSADFNGDGKPDLATGNHGNSASVLLGTGTGSFGAYSKFPALYGPWTIITADFNGDGRPDLATANQSSSNVSVLLNVVAPHVNINASSSAICAGLSNILTVSGATTYTWSPNTGVSNPNYTVTTAVVTPTVSNMYWVVGGENGCRDSSTVSISVVTPAVPNICMVTTDSASNYKYNMIVWDKTPYSHVDSFIVYRYDVMSSSYLRIGAVSKTSLSEFKDTAFSIGGPNGGNPLYSSWLYKLAIRDTCGNIGAKSPYHQSMFVQESGATFSWNAYTVETGQSNPVTGYSFLRDDNNTGNWHVLVNTAGLSTTDPNYANYPNGNWRVDALGFNCVPSMFMAGNNSNTSINKKSHSNTSKPTSVGIEQVSVNSTQLNIYPNPSGNQVTIGSNKELGNIVIYNSLGEIVFQTKSRGTQEQIDISRFSAGIYTVQINGSYSKVIKE